ARKAEDLDPRNGLPGFGIDDDAGDLHLRRPLEREDRFGFLRRGGARRGAGGGHRGRQCESAMADENPRSFRSFGIAAASEPAPQSRSTSRPSCTLPERSHFGSYSSDG